MLCWYSRSEKMNERARERIIRRQDWRCENAGKDWRDGLLLGNGNLGAVAYAPGHLEWVLNKVDVFDPTVEKALLDRRLSHAAFLRRIEKMSPKNTLFLNEAEAAPVSRKAIRDTVSAGILRLRFWQGTGWSSPAMPKTGQHLSLYDGELFEEMNAHSFHPCLKMFIPHGTGLLCIRITESGAPGRIHILELVRPCNEQLPAPERHGNGNTLVMNQRLFDSPMSYSAAVRILPHRSEERVRFGNAGEMLQNGDADILVSVKSSMECADPASAAIAELDWAQSRTFDTLEEENREWWRRWWNKSYADFGRYKKIQKYFTFSLYSLACNFGQAPMPGLNGLSFGPLDDAAPGVAYQGYTHDQNAQIPAMALLPSGRAELIGVLADTYWNVRHTLRRETRKLFGCAGIFLPLTMNQLGLEYPALSYRYTLCGSAYTGMVLARAWQYSRDETLLRKKIYPLLRELAIFYMGIMRKGEDNRYHLDWSVPPEIFTLTRDDSATMSMLKTVLETLVEAAALLKRDRKYLSLWRDILENYPEICKTPEGAYWCGPDIPFDHYFFGGHLWYPFFPAGVDHDRNAALKTLELIETQSVERSYADHTGEWHPNHEWSMFLTVSARLRLGDRQGGWHGLERFLELFAKENGLFTHDPILICDPAESEENERRCAGKLTTERKFCDGTLLTPDNPEVPKPMCVTANRDAKRLAPAVQEGSSSFLCMACEALLQSHGGEIRLFPGVPEDFSGSFSRLIAEGGFTVSAIMRKGRLIRAEITAGRDGMCRVRPAPGTIREKYLRKNETMKIRGI